MSDFLHNMKRYFRFNSKELSSLITIIIIYGIILGYNDGYSDFKAIRWGFNLISSLIMVSIVIITHEVGRKIMAIKMGYTSEFKVSWVLVLIAVAVGYFSTGKIELLLPATGMFIAHHERMRIGQFRYGHSYVDNAFIAFMGCYSNIIIAMLLKGLSFLPNQVMVMRLMELNIWYALLNLIPFDILFVLFRLEKADLRKHPAPMDGTYMLFSTRTFYVFCIAAIVITSLILFYTNIILSVILGAFLAFLVSFLYGIFRENII